ncbi:MAG: OmpH family outer membrane protein [Cytophagales bacterium]|nr:OmpH family outer membrane protein [Cytophagales bacterium]
MSNNKSLLQIKVLNFMVIAIVVGWIAYSHATRSKIAFVDSNRLIENYNGMKFAREAFQQKTLQWQANIDTLTAEFKRAVDDFEGSKAQLTAKEAELSKQLIETKRKQLVDYQQAIQQQSQQEDLQMTQKVLAEVNGLINEYAEQQGYDMVLGASGNGNIVYAKEYMDITNDVIGILNTK